MTIFPVYYGHFRYGGEVHEGNHEALITKKLFDEVQMVLKRRCHVQKPKKRIITALRYRALSVRYDDYRRATSQTI